ncbi:MAG: ABC transporter substrate-binding protein [Rhodospirillales bacterium]
MLKQTKRWLAGAVAFAAAGRPGFAGAADTPVRMAMEWSLQGLHAYIPYAAAKGEFAKRGVEVDFGRGYGTFDTVNRVANGDIDVGLGDLNVALAFNLAAAPDRRVVIVASLYDESEAALVARAKEIRTPADLKRRRLAAPPGVSARILYPLFARAANPDASEVVWQNVSANLREFVLAKSQVDGIVGSISTILPSLRNMGVQESELTVFRYADYGIELLGLGLFVRADATARMPDKIAGVVGGAIAGLKLMLVDPEAGVAALRTVDPLIEPGTELYRWQLARDRTLLTLNVRQNGIADLAPARVQRRLAALAEATGSQASLNADDVYTSRFLPPLAERTLP